jgi:hypothetical protein
MATVAVDRFMLQKSAPGESRVAVREGNREARVQWAEMGTHVCTLCGGYHSETVCEKIDDAPPSRGANGAYRGTATVTVIPPGWSFLNRVAGGPLPEVARGQVWLAPDFGKWRVDKVEGQLVSLERLASRYCRTKVRLSHMRTRWLYLPKKEAARG